MPVAGLAAPCNAHRREHAASAARVSLFSESFTFTPLSLPASSTAPYLDGIGSIVTGCWHSCEPDAAGKRKRRKQQDRTGPAPTTTTHERHHRWATGRTNPGERALLGLRHFVVSRKWYAIRGVKSGPTAHGGRGTCQGVRRSGERFRGAGKLLAGRAGGKHNKLAYRAGGRTRLAPIADGGACAAPTSVQGHGPPCIMVPGMACVCQGRCACEQKKTPINETVRAGPIMMTCMLRAVVKRG